MQVPEQSLDRFLLIREVVESGPDSRAVSSGNRSHLLMGGRGMCLKGGKELMTKIRQREGSPEDRGPWADENAEGRGTFCPTSFLGF